MEHAGKVTADTAPAIVTQVGGYTVTEAYCTTFFFVSILFSQFL